MIDALLNATWTRGCKLSIREEEATKTPKTRYNEDDLPPPPSPPQLKEVTSLDGVPRAGNGETNLIIDPSTPQMIIRNDHHSVLPSHNQVLISPIGSPAKPREISEFFRRSPHELSNFAVQSPAGRLTTSDCRASGQGSKTHRLLFTNRCEKNEDHRVKFVDYAVKKCFTPRIWREFCEDPVSDTWRREPQLPPGL
ncbi:unnamed protein product [Bemisia tabaci]|uniref:Uncharacterized protein n=1 Tax=Bemisia tabaci TaxID=7038 RepID=A0A9P0EZW2_BEMTA|nr:unnamed protein product [Bemisia tabaci]